MRLYKNFKLVMVILFLLISGNQMLYAQDKYDIKFYQTFINDTMGQWGEIIRSFEDVEKVETVDEKLILLNYYYGYIGFLLGEEQLEAGKLFLSKGNQLMDQILEVDQDNSTVFAYRSAFYGWEISIDHSKAPILGPKYLICLNKAWKLDSLNLQPNIEKGNFLFYAPKFLGGDANKAVRLYTRAEHIMEQNGLHKNNWMYFNLLVLKAKAYIKAKEFKQAHNVYSKMLEIEPDFIWVRDRLLPELEKKMK